MAAPLRGLWLPLLLLSATFDVGSASKCGLDFCSACDSKVPGPCEAADEHCETSLCLALCLESWTCEVEPSPCSGWDGCPHFDHLLAMPATQAAICGELKGYACLLAECCTAAAIDSWMESKVYGDTPTEAIAAVPRLPMQACAAGDLTPEESKARCDACKASISVTMTVEDTQCPPLTNPEGGTVDQVPISMPFIQSKFPEWKMQTPAFKSYRERCIKMGAAVSGVKGQVESEAPALMCACAGCCADVDPACPRSYTFNTDASVPDKFEEAAFLEWLEDATHGDDAA